MKKSLWPKLGCGVGLRTPHYPVITRDWPEVDWFEAISENYMDSGGKPISILEQIRAHYPVALHGVALSIGSIDPLNERYLSRLKNLADRIDPALVSDHLCWSGAGGEQLHDLLPLPFTEESIAHVTARVLKVQDFLKRAILLENVSTYVTYQHSVIPEWEFLSEVAKRSGCGILLDLNNVYVNSKNHGFDPYTYLSHIQGEKIGQFHLSGHTDMGTFLFDTHSTPVIEEVWDLYRFALKRWGLISTLVEWDENIPEWPGLMEERGRAKNIYDSFKEHKPEAAGLSNAISYSVPKQKKGASLQEVQNWMKSRIQTAGEKIPGDSFLNSQGGVAGEERISVYAGGYSARIQDGLSDVYETLRQVLGEDAFTRLSENYASRYPSHDYNLSLVGRHLPELIRELPFEKNKPYLEDLARFEWLIAESFHAFESRTFDRSRLSKIPLEAWESARLKFQASVFLFSSAWPVLDLWKQRHQLKPDPSVEKRDQCILIGRRGVQIRCELLDEKQFRLLEGLMQGRMLGEVCEDLAQATGDENFPVAEWFAGWVTDGLIADCVLSEITPQ